MNDRESMTLPNEVEFRVEESAEPEENAESILSACCCMLVLTCVIDRSVTMDSCKTKRLEARLHISPPQTNITNLLVAVAHDLTLLDTVLVDRVLLRGLGQLPSLCLPHLVSERLPKRMDTIGVISMWDIYSIHSI